LKMKDYTLFQCRLRLISLNGL